jgi:hypothetical protein
VAKRQHWLPQFYLRAFAVEGAPGSVARVWSFHRNGPPEPRLTSVADLGVQRYLYSPVLDSGERDHSVDKELQAIESLLGEIWPTVARGFVDLDREGTRKAMSLFVASLYSRHPKRAQDFARIQRQFIDQLDAVTATDDGDAEIVSVEINGETYEFDATEVDKHRVPSAADLHRGFVESVVPTGGVIARILVERRWAIVVANEPVFASSDTPVVVTNEDVKDFGFATPGTSVGVPLSPYRYLIIDDATLPNGYYEIKPGFAEAMNYRTWCAADRYLISAQASDLVLAGLMRFADTFGLSKRGDRGA